MVTPVEVQLDLFEDNHELHDLRERTFNIEKQVNNVRKGLFKRFGDLCKSVMSTNERVAQLEERTARQEAEIRQLKETICWMERVS